MHLRPIGFAVLLLVALLVAPSAQSASIQDFTCGSATDDIVRAGATNENAVVVANTYTINSGVTVTTSVNQGIIVCANEKISIAGTLSVEGRGATGGGIAVGGSTGLGGGGTVAPGCAVTAPAGGAGGTAFGGVSIDEAKEWFVGGSDDGAATDDAGAGGSGGRTGTAAAICSGGGGGGSYTAGANGGVGGLSAGVAGTGAIGGNGGGWLILLAPIIEITSTGTVSARGADGADVATVPSNSAGGSGGAGGHIWFYYEFLYENGTTNVNGGDGGNGGGSGATGGLGGTPTTAPTVGATPVTGGGAGSGGAAGSVFKISSAEAGSGLAGRDAGIKYTYDTDTANTDPTSGFLKFDSTTFSSVTNLRISETDGDAHALAPWLATWDDSTTTIRGTLTILEDQTPANLLVYHVTGTLTDNGAWDSFDLTYVTHSGSLADNDIVKLFFTPTGNKGDTGATGATGAAGADGDDGFNSLVKTTSEPAGANCADGGIKVESGLDDDRDNVLDAGEVDATTYVCHGAAGTNGVDGHNALVTSTSEAPGANCANGGQRIDSGTDDGAGAGTPDDGLLHADEVDDTGYACNGANGATGPQGPAGPQGAAGADGDDGFTSLTKITPEPAGVNCDEGGIKVESGVDDDRDGTLDAGEVDFTGYSCNGEQGIQGEPGESSADCEAGNCTGNFTIQQGFVDFEGYSDEQSLMIAFLFLLIVAAGLLKWWWTAGWSIVSFLSAILVPYVTAEQFVWPTIAILIGLPCVLALDLVTINLLARRAARDAARRAGTSPE